MRIRNVKILYFVLMIIIPVLFCLIKEKYLCAGIFIGVGTMIILFEKNKKIRETIDKLF